MQWLLKADVPQVEGYIEDVQEKGRIFREEIEDLALVKEAEILLDYGLAYPWLTAPTEPHATSRCYLPAAWGDTTCIVSADASGLRHFRGVQQCPHNEESSLVNVFSNMMLNYLKVRIDSRQYVTISRKTHNHIHRANRSRSYRYIQAQHSQMREENLNVAGFRSKRQYQRGF